VAKQFILSIAENREVGDDLRWLTLDSPELSASARPGQFLMLRCAPPGSLDPLLRRPFYLAGADRKQGQVQLLVWTHTRPGRYLAAARPGAVLDALGPLGNPFAIDGRSRTLLLIGESWGAPALIFLAHRALAQGAAVTLALLDETPLPPFLLPPDVELHGGVALDGAHGPGFDLRASIQWADQLCAALPPARLAALAQAVRDVRYRWAAGFAQVAIEAEHTLACGFGACNACAFETSRGWRTLCQDGPVFDLRDAV
jgi:dihydroorotate dehydrogenase electron transfer subunit